MIKNIIAPIQAWLLSQGKCVGCGTDLELGKKRSKKNKIIVTCKCSRIFIFDKGKKVYRRAKQEEV